MFIITGIKGVVRNPLNSKAHKLIATIREFIFVPKFLFTNKGKKLEMFKYKVLQVNSENKMHTSMSLFDYCYFNYETVNGFIVDYLDDVEATDAYTFILMFIEF